jgi:hypothetical protein
MTTASKSRRVEPTMTARVIDLAWEIVLDERTTG